MIKQTHSRALREAIALAFFGTVFASVGAARADGAVSMAGSTANVALHSEASATAGVEQRVRAELRAVMTELIESGAFEGASPQQIHLDIDAPPQRVSNLGLLVDSARSGSGNDGVRVLAVTPGGGAEHMGLRTGDVLVALNGTQLASVDDSAGALRRTVDELPNGSSLAFELRRDGRTQTLAGTLSSVDLPAMHLTIGNGTQVTAAGGSSAADGAAKSAAQGCGRISDFDVAPRQQQLHAAKIISIDGVAPGPSGAKSYRVDAGTHAVKVAEMIESNYLLINDRVRYMSPPDKRYKTLQVDVAPGTTTLIAARLNPDKRNESKDGAYWDPVAWKQVAESCR